MRKILFKGKRKDNGEWIEGFYVRLFEKENGFYKAKHYIFDGNTKLGEERYCGHGNYEQDVEICKFEVIPETVGQYTGLPDKNGKRSFEGDIVKWNMNYIVVWQNCKFVLKKDINVKPYDYVLSCFDGTEFEIIGNIHDNPELLN